MKKIYLIFRYIKYLIKSKNEYFIHSPFVFDFLTKVIYQKDVSNITDNIEELRIQGTGLNLDNLPNSIKKLYINDYKKELNNLPNSVEYLELKYYSLKIKKIPKNLKIVKCSEKYYYIDDFKDYEVILF